jgi:hypothetical protein
MYSRILVFFFLCMGSGVLASAVTPLDLAHTWQDSPMSNLLQSGTLLYHDIQNSDLNDENVLGQIIASQIDLVGAIYIFKYIPNSHIWHDDLLYLVALIDRIHAKFEQVRNDHVSHKIQFISQLFLQIKLLVIDLSIHFRSS